MWKQKYPLLRDITSQCTVIYRVSLYYTLPHSATYMHEFERPKNLPIAGRCEAGGATRELKLKMKIYIFSDRIELNNA